MKDLIKLAFKFGYSSGLLKAAAQDYGGMNYGSGYVPTWEERRKTKDRAYQDAIKTLEAERAVDNDFFNDIVLPMKQKYGGTPGKDYNSGYYYRDFPKSKTPGYFPLPFVKGINLGPYSIVSPMTAASAGRYTNAHETLGHMLHKDGLPWALSGYSPWERDTLNKAFEFDPTTIARVYKTPLGRFHTFGEQGATLKQIQRYLYSKLREQTQEQFGRKPNFEDWEKLEADYRSDSRGPQFPDLRTLDDGIISSENGTADHFNSYSLATDARRKRMANGTEVPVPAWRAFKPDYSFPEPPKPGDPKYDEYHKQLEEGFQRRRPHLLDAIFHIGKNGQRPGSYRQPEAAGQQYMQA